ncbi:class I SAM-dependent methyltransferase [Phormidium sp. LEGE 05292]|uniref:class I SAM-dependent methyltransferase n=1 Tax=[Phormidium] sp. LEGE 05292 TaxID=767427 RepID=UPI0018825486|nr:class I SAM-dependent methyltransferase [Phormidium sp. LEGE 05292]MBE9224306.1 class I SAM-dependent methyltransferase [Phormidium sp. LEGE 05292]
MDTKSSEAIEKLRQHFDAAPYPRIPLDSSPKDNIKLLYLHNFVTAYYLRNRQIIDTAGKVILDAGCGTGYKAFALALANPGAKIVGIDLSEESVNLAIQRLQYHGIENKEFHAISIEDLPKLGLEFDYINADEVLYLVPDAVAALQAMKAVLKPDGIIRTNLHSSLQRFSVYRAQQVFKIMGLMDETPGELEIGLVRETAKALKDNTGFKAISWNSVFETDDERILANLLLRGDKGFTVPQMFSALRAANLEFISMVNWQGWNLMNLFKESEKLPVALLSKLPQFSVEERLHLFELLHSVHRLLDFWCGHPQADKSFLPVSEWNNADWHRAKLRLHPNLNLSAIKQEIIASINHNQPWQFSRYLPFSEGLVKSLEPTTAASLLPLFDAPQTINNLVEHWQKIEPVDPVNLNPREPEVAWEQVKQLLTNLEQSGLVLVEIQN